jgi:hypothetical protein
VEHASGIEESPYNLAAIIITKDNGNQGPWKIDLGKGQFILMAGPAIRSCPILGT